eukprot:1979823-Alexandrium_andersonii.AAC.1
MARGSGSKSKAAAWRKVEVREVLAAKGGFHQHWLAPPVEEFRGREVFWVNQKQASVSYTHLTLPTICSV